MWKRDSLQLVVESIDDSTQWYHSGDDFEAKSQAAGIVRSFVITR